MVVAKYKLLSDSRHLREFIDTIRGIALEPPSRETYRHYMLPIERKKIVWLTAKKNCQFLVYISTMNIANYFQHSQMIAKIEKVQKSKQKCLALDNYDLTEFPRMILDCHSLHILMLQKNQITTIPDCLGTHLSHLKHLSLQFNRLDKFPECLKSLVNLVSLNISHNPIDELPIDLYCFKELKSLCCSSCGLKSLPGTIGHLKNLETLVARNNQFKGLPKTIGHLTELRWVSLESNNLRTLPNSFQYLLHLHHLNLNANSFTTLPKVLMKLNALMYVHFQRNRIKSIDRTVAENIRAYKITLLNNPLKNTCEYSDMKHLIVNSMENSPENRSRQPIIDSSDSDTEWENSCDSLYRNYYGSTDSSDVGFDSDNELVSSKAISFFLAQ